MTKPNSILFCCPVDLNPRLGMARAILSIANEFSVLGWKVDCVSPNIIKNIVGNSGDDRRNLLNYLIKFGSQYDVIEYDHTWLPSIDNWLPKHRLLVARSQLLVHHVQDICFPKEFNIRSFFGNLFRLLRNTDNPNKLLTMANKTISNSDFVIVLNHQEKLRLENEGFAEDRIFVIGNGLSKSEINHFSKVNTVKNIEEPVICFVGTFYPRKGSADFPPIFEYILNAIPNCKLRLVGVARDEWRIRNLFSKKCQDHIQIINEYSSVELPNILEGCLLGIFPSYLEGFPLAVLEMLAAGIPVVGYDSPGLSMILPDRFLVKPYQKKVLAEKAVQLLRIITKREFREDVRCLATKHQWQDVAFRTSELYKKVLFQKQQSFNKLQHF